MSKCLFPLIFLRKESAYDIINKENHYLFQY